ncbi:MAG: GntR family transcriptional regulator, partial [Flavobacteriales bacterium]
NAPIKAGDKRIIYMFLDDRSQKLVGSMKWKDFCFKDEPEYEVNQKVKIMIGEETDLGRNVLIDNAYYGLIYDNEIFEDLEIGEEREAFIKNQREDGDIDVSLQPLGYSRVLSSVDKIVELLKENEGVLEIGDKSSPELITALTGMSKKTFKKAIGDLYKKKLVVLEPKQVKLIDQ